MPPFRRMNIATLVGSLGVVVGTSAVAAPFGVAASQSSQANANPAAQQTLSFAQFDAALGTLTGVQFTLNSTGTSVSSSIVGNFTAGEGGTASGSVAATFGITGPGNIALFAGTGGAASSCETFDFDCASSNNDGVTLPTFAPLVVLVASPADLAPFIGIGTFDALVSLELLAFLDECANSFGAGGASCTASGSASWDGTLEIQYRYEPFATVPEPGTLALLGLAAVGLAFRRRPA